MIFLNAPHMNFTNTGRTSQQESFYIATNNDKNATEQKKTHICIGLGVQ